MLAYSPPSHCLLAVIPIPYQKQKDRVVSSVGEEASSMNLGTYFRLVDVLRWHFFFLPLLGHEFYCCCTAWWFTFAYMLQCYPDWVRGRENRERKLGLFLKLIWKKSNPISTQTHLSVRDCANWLNCLLASLLLVKYFHVRVAMKFLIADESSGPA